MLVEIALPVINIICGICSGPILTQEKQGRNQGAIREMSGRMTSLI